MKLKPDTQKVIDEKIAQRIIDLPFNYIKNPDDNNFKKQVAAIKQYLKDYYPITDPRNPPDLQKLFKTATVSIIALNPNLTPEQKEKLADKEDERWIIESQNSSIKHNAILTTNKLIFLTAAAVFTAAVAGYSAFAGTSLLKELYHLVQ